MPAALLPRDVPPRPLSELAMLLGLSTGRAGPDPLAGPGGPVTVSGVTHDSRRVRPGDLYAALPGSQHHGARFCDDAADAGAVAVLTDPDGKSLARHCGLPVFVVSDPRARLGEIASWIHGNPSGQLTLIGVTGTSGKTSTTYLLESGLRRAGHVTGLLGGV
ncbi:MAG: Mur ligase domain-containing protein, partial [Streptosporangiaceae bacterium]